MAGGRYGDAWRGEQRRIALVDRLHDPKEIGDVFAMASWDNFHRGLYREALDYASSCIERSRGLDSGSVQRGLAWRMRASFVLGDWEASLADHAEIEQLHEQDTRDLPPASR